MKILQLILAALPICTLAAEASAKILYTDRHRQSSVTLDNRTNLRIFPPDYEPRFLADELSAYTPNHSIAKVDFTALNTENRIKHVVNCSLRTQAGAPETLLGSTNLLDIRFNLEEETTFEFSYTTSDNSQGEYLLFNLGIYGLDQDTSIELFVETNSQTAGSTQITLGPGRHWLRSYTSMSRNLDETPGVYGHSSFHSTFELRVVPAPTTLAALAPLGIAAIRRRR